MTRKEEINERAYELGQVCFPDECNIWARENYEAQKVEWACKQMLEWADEHPKKGLVSLDKVVKYLQSKLEYSPDIDGLQIYDTGIEEFVNDFRKAMEE